MGANGNDTTYSLKDILAYKNPSGELAPIAEVLTQSNPILDHIPYVEGMTETGDIVTRRKLLGTPMWRRYNESVLPSVTKVSSVTEITAQIQDWSEVDADLADKSGDLNGFLLRQSTGKLEGISQEVATTFMYGNLSTDAKTFDGFMPRLSTLNSTYGNGAPIVLSAGGTTASGQGSILIVGWAPEKVYGIYPKGSMGGLKFENKGRVTKDFSDGSMMDVYRAKYSWDVGLAVADYRYAIRLANIDAAAIATIGEKNSTAPELYLKILDALSYMPTPGAVGLKMYMPRRIWSALNQIAAQTGNRNTTLPVQDAGFVFNISGVPCYLNDCMLMTEDVVTA